MEKLTRQQKRQLKRLNEKKSNEYVITEESLKQIEMRIRGEVVAESFTYTVLLPLLVLRKFGFGKKRAIRFINEMKKQIEMMDEGFFQLSDIEDMVMDEYGLVVENRGNNVEIKEL